ncbi:MAG: branched-chain amino acid ABC transporter permease [Planctomycetes bacterium]|nr:branched-chain amino acid ABC transporter permease [Planctomycetota bacterium]MBM4078446.1 branched-chain amino acid ABC transporter permease [Planctomycetota bacterium]
MAHDALQLLVIGISLGSIYALIALGYTLVYGVLRLINFAHGDVMMVGAYIGYFIAKCPAVEQSPVVARLLVVFLGAMAGCAALGVVIERFAYRPLRNQPRLTALITAIGVSLFLEYGGQLVLGATPRQDIPQLVPPRTVAAFGGVEISSTQVLVLAVSLALMALLELFVMKTKTGKAMRAISFDHTAAALVGVNTDRVIAFTFALGSALAAAAGVMMTMSYPKVDPIMGLIPGIKAFVAAVLGGIGNIRGAMLGGILLGVLESLVGYFWSGCRDGVAFAVLILILLFRPSGLLGKGAVERA